ncbi:phage tail tube protein [uncultured Bacteroides sp.]|uniref:phage tail tube protein n=1 Tax=uncultured Bacteroides sp. TaxID=162156 RepID=UPI002AA8932E|nr:phage tail tube protein [uncultured Bacteroides sp.]
MAASYSQTDLIKGNSLLLYANSNPVAFAKSCDLSISSDSIDCTNKFSGNFKTAIPGQISYTVSSDFLLTYASGDTSFDTLLAVQLSGGTIPFTIGTTTDSVTFAMTTGKYSGTAIIKSISLKAEENGICSCSLSLDGTGALTKV